MQVLLKENPIGCCGLLCRNSYPFLIARVVSWSNDRGHKLLSHYRLSAGATRRIPRRRFLHWLWPKRLLSFLKVLLRDKDGCYAGLKAKGAFVSESALHSFDGDKPNSVGVIAHADDHSSHPDFSECPANFHSPWCDDTRGFYRAGCPSSVLSCTAWGFSCLANYSTSGELLPRLFTLACAFLKEPAVCFL
jgi:hypothetical protein